MEKEYISYLLLLMILSCLFVACSDEANSPVSANGNVVYTIPEETGDGWQTASLSSVGLSETIKFSSRELLE